MNGDYKELLEKIYNLTEQHENEQIQRKKFELLSFLLSELCKNQSSKKKITDLSSFIVLLLNIYKRRYPLDRYSTKDEKSIDKTKSNKTKHRILEKEFSIE